MSGIDPHDVEAVYRSVESCDDTETRIWCFERYGYSLGDIDNYGVVDRDFDQVWHRWLLLFQCTKGTERAAAISVAAELFRSSPPTGLTGTEGIFSHGFSESTRNYYFAKAMCIMWRHLVEKPPK